MSRPHSLTAKRVLITGGTGYIGSHCAVELIARGYEPVLLDNLCNSSKDVIDRIEQITGQYLRFYEIDIRDYDSLNAVVKQERPIAVFHLAALKSVRVSCENPILYFDNNISGTISVLKAVLEQRVPSLVFSSSATVYGVSASLPLREAAPTSPTNPYGYSKLLMEEVIKQVATSDSGLNSAVLRYFNPVGAHPSGLIGEDPLGSPENLVPYIAQVAAGMRPKVYVYGNDYPTNDGTGVRDYIHIADLARAHADAMEYLTRTETSYTTLNLGTGRGYSVLEVIRAFERACGKTIPFEYAQRRAGDIAECYADPSLAEALLGWRATHDLDEMCADTWRWQARTDATE